MASLSYCNEVIPRRDSLSKRTIVKHLIWFLIFTTLALSHIYIRFKIRDFLIETRKLQDRKSQLTDTKNSLESTIENLKNGDRLHEYAITQLHMIDYNPKEIEYLTIPKNVIAKYEGGERYIPEKERQWPHIEEPQSVVSLLASVFRVNQNSTAQEKSRDARLFGN
jgi:cell division protein FtsB